MPNPVIGIAAAGVGSSAVAARAQSRAARSASAAQQASAQAGIEEQRRQFDAVQELLKPFVDTGSEAIQAQAALAGLGDPEQQREIIQNVQQGPEFQALLQQGEQAILANASATGGLRGGNTQAALGQFRPQLLSQALGDRYSRLGGLAGLGQASAAGQAAAAQNLGQNISGLLQQSGAAQAGSALAAGQATANFAGNIGQSLGNVFGSQIPAGGAPAGSGIFSRWGF